MSRVPSIAVMNVGRSMPLNRGLGRVIHGPDHPAPDEVFMCPHCSRQFAVKKSMQEHATTCINNPNKKGPFFCHVEGCKSKDHPFARLKNLNAHLTSCHGWKEHHQ